MLTKDQLDQVARWKSPAAKLIMLKKIAAAQKETVKVPNAALAKGKKI